MTFRLKMQGPITASRIARKHNLDIEHARRVLDRENGNSIRYMHRNNKQENVYEMI